MEAAPDLRDVVVESFSAYSAGDMTFLENHISHQPGAHALGADPSEWWADAAAILKDAEAEASDGIRFVRARSRRGAKGVWAGLSPRMPGSNSLTAARGRSATRAFTTSRRGLGGWCRDTGRSGFLTT